MATLRYDRKPVGVSPSTTRGASFVVGSSSGVQIHLPQTDGRRDIEFAGQIERDPEADYVVILGPENQAVLEKVQFSVSGLRPRAQESGASAATRAPFTFTSTDPASTTTPLPWTSSKYSQTSRRAHCLPKATAYTRHRR